MSITPKNLLPPELQETTPARIFTGRSGSSYPTATQMALRVDHAFARDAVQLEFDAELAWGKDFLQRWNIFSVSTLAESKEQFLLHPDLGRRLSEKALADIAAQCLGACDVQVVLGDGLSAEALRMQVPSLLPLLQGRTQQAGLTWGRPFFVKNCRVGVLNDIGVCLQPKIVVLLIGERPGLATSESMSAYMAYRPNATHSDADRNLISNIHRRGVSPEEAARRIVELAQKCLDLQKSGITVKESFLGKIR